MFFYDDNRLINSYRKFKSCVYNQNTLMYLREAVATFEENETDFNKKMEAHSIALLKCDTKYFQKLIENEDINLYIAPNKVIFEFGGTRVYSRIIVGDFPKTSRMIPSSYPYQLKVNANSFIDAMARVSLLSVERERIVKLSLSDDSVEVSSKSEQIGSANEKIELYEYNGGKFEISFNVDYVTDAIKATQSEDVLLSFAGEMNAFRITAPGDDSLIQIITPVRSYY